MIQLNNKMYVLSKCVKLINCEQTGSAEEFAKKLNISRGKLFNVLEDFRNLGLQIEFNRNKRSYINEGSTTIRLNTPYEVISKDELTDINGGFVKKIVQYIFLD